MRYFFFLIYIILQISAVACLAEDDNGPAENTENIQDSVEGAETIGIVANGAGEEGERERDNQATENAQEKDSDDDTNNDTDNDTDNDTETEDSAAANRTYTIPTCTAEAGCKPPLNCSNLTDVSDEHLRSLVTEHKVVSLTEDELTQVLSNKSLPCACLLVMFYAKWCPFSIRFIPTYNLLGHTLPQLPVLAFDFGANYSHKYPMAYVPQIMLFFSGKRVYSLDTSQSAEELTQILSNMTGVEPHPLPQSEDEIKSIHDNSPLPQELEEDYTMFYLSLLGIAFICAVNILKSEQSLSVLSTLGKWLRTKFSKEKTQ